MNTQLTLGDAAVESYLRGELDEGDAFNLTQVFPAQYPEVVESQQITRVTHIDFNSADKTIEIEKTDIRTWI